MLTIEEIRVACARSEPVRFVDPYFSQIEKPLCETFYPFGFPLQIETNCEEVLICAAASWQGFVKLFDTKPIRVRIFVTSSDSSECPPTPVSRVQQHLLSNVADSENFCTIDVAQGFVTMWLTEAAVANRGYFRYFFLESPAMAVLAASHATAIHAACVEHEGCGILLCGDSGAGKSSLSYACARAGWTFIADDASFLVNNRSDRLVVGNCNQARFRPSAADLFSELNGKEIVQRSQVGKPSIELNIQPVRGISVSFTSHINHIVFLNRRDVKRQELVQFPTDVARYSMQQVLFSLPPTRKVQIAMIDHLLDAGALELRYNDFNWAIERLTQLAERGC